jgi:hypothetical protein
VAQDLLLSVLAIRVAKHPLLREQLLWRGGTCLHKLHLDRPRRYSEDLDYVLVGGARHGPVRDALIEVVHGLGMSVASEEVNPATVKVWAEADVASVGARIRVKFEVNCDDAEALLGAIHLEHAVSTRVWEEGAAIPTFRAAELVGTKFRALAQRRKGRDLFDLWLARQTLPIADEDLAPTAMYFLDRAGVVPARFRERLAEHALDPAFCADVDALVREPEPGFDPQRAARELIRWSDRELDPLFNAMRNPNAVAREQRRWAKEGGWAPGKLRCPEYRLLDGHLIRCPRWHEAEHTCPQHGAGES